VIGRVLQDTGDYSLLFGLASVLFLAAWGLFKLILPKLEEVKLGS
jgi:hypothetical protein